MSLTNFLVITRLNVINKIETFLVGKANRFTIKEADLTLKIRLGSYFFLNKSHWKSSVLGEKVLDKLG